MLKEMFVPVEGWSRDGYWGAKLTDE